MSKEQLYGINSVLSLLKNVPSMAVEIFISSSKQIDQRINQIISLSEKNGITVQQISKDKLNAKSDTTSHQGVLAIINSKTFTEQDLPKIIEKHEKPLIIVLDGVQDPHNLGAILRSAESFGVAAVIAPKDKNAGITPVVRKIASGAAELVSFIQVKNLSRTLKILQQQGVWLIGLDCDQTADDLQTINLQGSVALILGSEGKGIRDLTRKQCDHLAKIPMQGNIESLNVSVAAGVCLYEVVRQKVSMQILN